MQFISITIRPPRGLCRAVQRMIRWQRPAVHPDLIQTLPVNLKAELKEAAGRGRTTADLTRLNDPRKDHRMAVDVDVRRFSCAVRRRPDAFPGASWTGIVIRRIRFLNR